MGNMVLKPAARAATRPLKNYNVEHRAIKVIEKDKPSPAPPHPAMQRIMEEIRNDPTLEEKSKVDPILADKLQHVYLTSKGSNTDIRKKIGNLPQKTLDAIAPEFGYTEPAVIPEGKVTFRQVLEFMKLNEENPEDYPAYKIAEMYKIDVNEVQGILRHFRTFTILYPTEKKPETSLLKSGSSSINPIRGS